MATVAKVSRLPFPNNCEATEAISLEARMVNIERQEALLQLAAEEERKSRGSRRG